MIDTNPLTFILIAMKIKNTTFTMVCKAVGGSYKHKSMKNLLHMLCWFRPALYRSTIVTILNFIITEEFNHEFINMTSQKRTTGPSDDFKNDACILRSTDDYEI